LLFTFSAILRYTNNMTISTGGWMDGRPVAWAKHAYWIPNQFVEVNPIEYLDKRATAIVAGMKYQQEQVEALNRVYEFRELEQGNGTHIIWTQSSQNLNMPECSVDAIITDPPYGSNVQYGELTHYWLVWLRDDIPMGDRLFTLDNEILVNRKSANKNYDDYFKGLYEVFKEGYRLLKLDGVMVFTFNNKDMKAWFSVIRAAIDAGFVLEPDGVIYQEPIENYRNTAHTRFAGSLHGDFIYTFRKLAAHNHVLINSVPDKKSVQDINVDVIVRDAIKDYMRELENATTSELYIAILQHLIPVLVHVAKSSDELDTIDMLLRMNNLDNLLAKYLVFSQNAGIWEKAKERDRV
jgi:putative DNA methylase